MSAGVGAAIVDVLERAGERYLREPSPELYQQFLLQVGGADTVRYYRPSVAYWDQVQALLDCFFTSEQRVEICCRMMRRVGLCGCPEFRGFWARAVAERHLSGLSASAAMTTVATSWLHRASAPRAG